MRAWSRALLFVAALAPLGAAAPPADVPRLDPFRPLVGGRWVGGGFLAGIGSYKSTREFAWTLDGKYIEMRHVLALRDSTFSESGYLGWDPERKAVSLWIFASDGSRTTASQVPARPGAILLEGNTLGDSVVHWRSLIRRRGDDELSIVTEIERQGSWIPYTSAMYRREKP